MKNSLRGVGTTTSSGFQNQQFIDEINETGCYIHVIGNQRDKVKEDLDKVKNHAVPTPATHVGTAPFGLYNQAGQWAGCSGIVFSPDTPSLLSHKHDFWSNRLSNCKKDLSNFKGLFGMKIGTKEPVEKYAKYVSEQFNGLGQPTSSFFYNNPGKILKLKEDMQRTRAKYDEMKMRTYRDQWNAGGVENSSKFVILDLLKERVDDPKRLSKAQCIAEIEKMILERPELKATLDHPVLKIKQFSDARFKTYLTNAHNSTLREKKKNFYSGYFEKNQTLAPNEHLLLPEMNEICGVYVNTSNQASIEKAYQIYTELIQRQSAKGPRKYIYAIAYQPLNTPNRPIYMATWARAVLPWTESSLVEFACTGKITADDGKKFSPNHCELPSMIGYVNGNDKFVEDLSRIKSEGNNLLHLAVKNRRSENVIKFFLLWQVSPTKFNGDDRSAQSLAKSAGGALSQALTNPASQLSGTFFRKQFVRDNPCGVK